MKRIEEYLQGVKTVAIGGHVNPDGDCVGSCMGVYLYLRDNFPEIRAQVYLESVKQEFRFMEEIEKVCTVYDGETLYDLVILLDISSRDRVGVIGSLADRSEKILCFDHHVTNRENFTWLYNYPDASSTCEVVCGFLDMGRIGRGCAEAIYTGIAHDTGIFQYSSTAPSTMRMAADLMEKGIDFSRIVDESFYQKTYLQNQIMGRTLMESILLFEGRAIVGVVRWREMKFYGLNAADMEGIVSQLRNTEGVEVAIFLYELKPGTFKVSLRSRKDIDVSRVAAAFSGGGHVRAAGCTMAGSSPYDVINNLTYHIDLQFKELEEGQEK